MKKISIVFVFLFLTISYGFCMNMAYAEEEKSYYAKVQSTGVQFCSLPSESSALFEVPYSYFVKVDSIVDDYFKVTYNGIDGYVKKDKVKLMNGTPIVPYAEASFKLFTSFGIYQSPNKTSIKLANLDENSEELNYFGTRQGQQVSSNNSTWYYCKTVQDGKEIYGYVFSGVTDLLTTIPVNSEVFETVSESNLTTNSTEFSTLSTGTKVLLIVSISVPSLLILYFLIKPSKIMQVTKNRKQSKKESKKIRHGDYFEFDESDL